MGKTQAACPHCRAQYNVDAVLLGKAVRCKRCGNQFVLSPTVAVASAPLGAQGKARQQSEAWPPGATVLDDFLVEKTLGAGSFGVVYLVGSRSTKERFAVKRARMASAEQRNAFIREIQTWIGLPEHPHLATCRFFRSAGDEIVIFAEYVDGGSLASWIGERRLYEGGKEKALARVLDVAIQFAWGLHAAHEQGLIHQDVKLANVLMTRDGVVKVTDFGLGAGRASAQAEPAWGAKGSMVFSMAGGTPAYLSPEQAEAAAQAQAGVPREERAKLTRRTDLWSWGVSVLEMFLGERRWEQGQIVGEGLDQYLEEGPADASIPPMPREVAELLRQCFRQNPEDRPKTMLEAAEALRKAYARSCGRQQPRALPPFPRRDAESPVHDRRTTTGVTWDDPRAWLEKALRAAGRDTAEASKMIPPRGGSFQAQAVADLAVYDAAREILVAARRRWFTTTWTTVPANWPVTTGPSRFTTGW